MMGCGFERLPVSGSFGLQMYWFCFEFAAIRVKMRYLCFSAAAVVIEKLALMTI